MLKQPVNLGIFKRLRLLWFRMLRAILHLWVRSNVLPTPFEELRVDWGKPVCFV